VSMKPEETIDFNIRWAWYGIARYYNNKAAKYGSSMSVGYVLLNIDVKKGTPSTKLGPKMGMEPRSLTRMLKSMEEKGLIFRKSDKIDGRMVRLFLTKFGKKIRGVSKDTVIQFNLAVQEKIPESKLKIFYEVIAELNKVLDNQEILNGYEKVN